MAASEETKKNCKKTYNYKDKNLVLRNTNRLKVKDIFINEDCCKETTEVRK